MTQILHKIVLALCGSVLLVSVFFIPFAVHDIVNDKDVGTATGMLIFFGFTGFSSIAYLIYAIRQGRIQKKRRKETELLKLISERGGRVTPIEIAANSELLLEEAQTLLERLCKKGLGEVHVTEQGSWVYVFEGVLSRQEKKSAKSPLPDSVREDE